MPPHPLRRAAAPLLASILAAACAAPPAAPSASPSVAPATGTLVLMGTTDTHGWLLPHDYYTGQETPNGLARLVPQIDSVRAANPGRTVLVESGDLLQGNPMDFVYSRLAPGETHPVAAAMNHLAYDAAAIGNHEFNYGIAHLDAVAAQSRFPWLSANTYRHGTRTHAYRPYTFVRRAVGGETVTVGITSVVPPGVMIWDRENVTGRLEVRDMVESVRPVVAEMRARGADLVVVAAHSGLEGSSYDTAATKVAAENDAARMAREVPGIDVVFLGHTHRELADTAIGGTLLLQAKNWGTSLAVAELSLARERDAWRVTGKRGRILKPRADARAPALEAVLAEAHERTKAYVTRRIGTSTAEWTSAQARTRDTPILDLINEVQRSVTGADLSAASAFSLRSRIPQGPVTVADVAGLYIYDNTLKAVRIDAAQLRAYLEKSAEYWLPCPGGACPRAINPEVPGYNFDIVSGVDYTLDVSKPFGQRVVRLERAGRPVRDTDTFTLALNNYRASGSGGFNMLVGLPVVYDRGEGIRELLIREIERRGTLRPEDVFRRSWEIVPAAAAEKAQAELNAPGAW